MVLFFYQLRTDQGTTDRKDLPERRSRMETGVYTRPFIVQPDHCGKDAGLSPVGTFIAFQALSAEHAQVLGIGAADMARKKRFWVTVHNRVDFLGRAWLLDELEASTWAEPCEPDSLRCFRGYSLTRKGKPVAIARTQWAIIGEDGQAVPFKESGFPSDYEFTERQGITQDPIWFEDDFTDADVCGEFTVRSTDIDFGLHMNNIAYIRKFLDQFPSDKITGSAIRSIEVHYGHPCMEGKLLKVYRRFDGTSFWMCIRNSKGQTASMVKITPAL